MISEGKDTKEDMEEDTKNDQGERGYNITKKTEDSSDIIEEAEHLLKVDKRKAIQRTLIN